jgi:hypothetical protein
MHTGRHQDCIPQGGNSLEKHAKRGLVAGRRHPLGSDDVTGSRSRGVARPTIRGCAVAAADRGIWCGGGGR